MAKTYSRIYRLLDILMLVQSDDDWNGNRLAAHFHTTKRNIYRDMDVLRQTGIPIDYNDESGSYRVRRDFFMPPIDLTLDEVLALTALADRISEDDQIACMRPAAKASMKIRSQLPAAIRKHLAQVDPHVAVQLARSSPASTGEDSGDNYSATSNQSHEYGRFKQMHNSDC